MAKLEWPLHELVEIEWNDALSRAGDWDTVQHHKDYVKVGPLRSVGYLVRADRLVVSVAQSMSSVTQHISDIMTVPRGAVRQIRRIRKRK